MSVYGDDSMWRLIEHYGMNTAKPQLTWEEFEKLKAQDANSYLNESVSQLKAELAEAKELITSYQIAKDNMELRLARAVLANDKPIVGTFAGHWTY